jgi:hypothetical protein
VNTAPISRLRALIVGIALLGALLSSSSPAGAQIKQPGAHPPYVVEIDAHVLLQYGDRLTGHQGIGLGARAMVPFVHNGPVPQINNDIGISFGADLAFFGGDEECRRRGVSFYASDCSAFNLWFPAAAEWNFYLTPVVSVFIDLGLALQYQSWSFEGLCNNAPCNDHESNLDVEFVSFVGGRFRIFGDRAGLIVRLGWPYVSVGASFAF